MKAEIKKLIENELKSCYAADESGIRNIKINSDLGIDIIHNVVKKLDLARVIVPKGTFNCGQERVFGEEKCKQQCKDCLVEYNDN